MCDDNSIDIEELDFQRTVTAYSSHVEPRTRGRQTYSSRGSNMSTGGLSSSMTFNPRPPPAIPARQPFTRAHSISGSAGVQPKPTLVLKRSQSVSISIRSSPTSTQTCIDSIEDLENANPNYDPLAENASPRKRVRKARNFGKEDHMPLSNSCSFSSLAHFREDGLSWAPPFPPRPPPARDFDFPDVPQSSPAASSVGSTRKRGIWFPLDDFHEVMSTGGFCVSRPSKARPQPPLLSPRFV